MIRTDEQAIFENSIDRFFKDNLSHATLRQLSGDFAKEHECERFYEQTILWKKITEMGWLALYLPENQDGAGMEFNDALLLAEYAGRFLVPLPLSYWQITYPFLRQFELSHGAMEWVEAVINGQRLIPIGFKHPESHTVSVYYAVSQSNQTDVWMLSYANGMVTLQIYSGTVNEHSIDPLLCSGTLISEEVVFEYSWECSEVKWDVYQQELRLAQAAELLGVASKAFEITVDYVKERQQFGKSISGFQAVKHPLAQDWMDLDNARLVLNEAAKNLIAINANENIVAGSKKQTGVMSNELLVTIVEVLAQESSQIVTKHAVQFHGAMGITWECIVHYYLKRSLLLNSLIEQYGQMPDRLDNIWALSAESH